MQCPPFTDKTKADIKQTVLQAVQLVSKYNFREFSEDILTTIEQNLQSFQTVSYTHLTLPTKRIV